MTSLNEKTKFRNSVIEATVGNASTIPFYAKFWKGIDLREIRSTENLHLLPVIDKKIYHTKYQNTVPLNKGTEIVSFSTGTDGKISFRYRSVSEIAFIRKFFTAVYRLDEDINVSKKAYPLALAFYNRYHGKKIPIPGRVFSIEAGLFEEGHVNQVLTILNNNFRISNVSKRVTQIHGEIKNHKVLMAILLAKGINLKKSPVKMLVTSGYVSEFWKRLLEKNWQAKVTNHYSLSEIFGGATMCLSCGWFHIETHVVPELADPLTLKHQTTGKGVLLLSELFPFIQLQPLIRYYTGDLVEMQISHCSQDEGSLSFKMLGRLSQSIIDKKRRKILVYPSTLHELLDEIPCVRKKNVAINGTPVENFEIGEPIWTHKMTSSKEVTKLTIFIACKFNPHVYQQETEKLQKKIYREILNKCTTLDEGIKQKKYLLEIKICLDDKITEMN